MKTVSDGKERMVSAFQLLTGAEISVGTFENVRKLLKGLHPGVDKKLEVVSKALDKLQKVQSGDVISLSAEHLPEETEDQKKRKKALIFFIHYVKDLKSEIKRVEHEFQNPQNSTSGQAMKWGRVIKFAKGPFGLITLGAIVIVAVVLPIVSSKKTSNPPTQPVITQTPANSGIQVITYQGKQIPLSQLRIANAHYPGCDGRHYHALDTNTETVTALDGTVLYDPGGCGFGKVFDMQITNITK